MLGIFFEYKMPRKFFIPAQLIIAGFALLAYMAAAFGQEIQRPIKKNNSKPFNKTHPLKMSSPKTLTISELDAEKMRALTGRQGGRSRPLLLYLWYTDCQPCRPYFTDVERIAREYQGRGLDIVTVAVGPMDNQEKLAHYFSAPPQVPVYLLKELTDEVSDEVFQKDWEVTVPATFGYDARGQVVFRHTAIVSDYYSVLKRAAEQLLSHR